MKFSGKLQTRRAALWDLLQRGLWYGGGASLLGGLLGYLLLERRWSGVLTGLNVAGLLLCILAGSLAQGAFGIQSGVAMSQARLGRAAPGVCFLLGWLLSGWR